MNNAKERVTTGRCEGHLMVLTPPDRMDVGTGRIGPIVVNGVPSVEMNKKSRTDHIGHRRHAQGVRRMPSIHRLQFHLHPEGTGNQ